MPISALAGIMFGVAVVSIGFYHSAFVAPRLRAIGATLDGPLGPNGDVDSAGSAALVRASLTSFAKETGERLERLERTVAHDLLRIGFVRYNSFSDVGSDQSFTLALVDRDGDGVVVTSIFGREETRTYGKSVLGFVAQQGVSKEEQAAIAMARDGEAATTVGS